MSEYQLTQGRQLVQRLSRAAAMLDKSLLGLPERQRQVDGIDYQDRQRKLEQKAMQELIQLKAQLQEMQLK